MTQTGPKILIVDDEPHIRRFLEATLHRANYRVQEAASARDALHALTRDPPDAVLLDLGLPDRDGLELIPLLKQGQTRAVLVISARDSTREKVTALDLGADDYITKPFDTEELLARLRVSLRPRHPGETTPAPLHIGPLCLDFTLRRIQRDGVDVHLTPREYALLAELAHHAGRVLTHAHLLRTLWGPAHGSDVEYLRVAVRALRQKLEINPASPALIRNEPGVGYRLMVEDSFPRS